MWKTIPDMNEKFNRDRHHYNKLKIFGAGVSIKFKKYN